MTDSPWTIESLARFFRILDDADLHDGFWWRANEPSYEPFKILINCNDLFYWACADCEAVTPDTLDVLEQSLKDIMVFHNTWGDWVTKNIRDGNKSFGDPECPPYVANNLALLLYCCRVRKMRPQGAYYDAFPPGVMELFDAAGPEREAPGGSFGNTRRREWKSGSAEFEPETKAPWRCTTCRANPNPNEESPRRARDYALEQAACVAADWVRVLPGGGLVSGDEIAKSIRALKTPSSPGELAPRKR